MPETLVNDFSSFLLNPLAKAAGAGTKVQVTLPLPAGYVGKSARFRTATSENGPSEIVLYSLTSQSEWEVVSRQVEDSDRFPAADWPAGAALEMVLTDGGLSQIIIDEAAPPDLSKYAELAGPQTFTDDHTFAGNVMIAGVCEAATFVGDGSNLTNLSPPDLSAYARFDTAQTFTAFQTFSASLGSPATTGTAFPGTRFGAGAAPNITPGTVANTVIGQDCAPDMTTGNHNTVLGFQAATGLKTGSENTVIGSQLVVPAAFAQGVVFGRQHVITGTSRVVCIGLANTVAHDNTICLGTFADSTQNGQFVTGRDVSAWTMSALTTVTGRPVAEFRRAFVDVTDATRTGRIQIGAYNVAAWQEGVRIDADPAGVRLGFFGAAAVARPVLNYSKAGAGETAATAAVRAALASLGLVDDQTTA